MLALLVKVCKEHCVILHFVEALILLSKERRADSLMNSQRVSLHFDEERGSFLKAAVC